MMNSWELLKNGKIKKLPLEIQKLINALENIGKIEGVEVITVILVNSFPEYINNENLLVKKGSVENLKTLLFRFLHGILTKIMKY